MTGKAIGVRGGGRRWLATSHPPPSLPLEGGRDELGKGWVLGGCVDGWVPACAGMTEWGRGGGGVGDRCGRGLAWVRPAVVGTRL